MSALEDVIENEIKEAYNKGLEDAWELANKLNNMVMQDIINIYGFCLGRDEVFVVMTPQEALAKLEAYEKEQAEIKVGDVVINEDAGTKGVVAKVRGEIIYVLFRDGSAGKHEKTDFKKTGKHIAIQKILDELKEGLEWHLY